MLEISTFNSYGCSAKTKITRTAYGPNVVVVVYYVTARAFRQVFVRTKQGQWNTLRGHRIQNQNTRIRETCARQATDCSLAQTEREGPL